MGKCLEMPLRTVQRHMSKMNDKQKVKLINFRVSNMAPRNFNNFGEWFVTESSLYKLIFKSRASKAEEFFMGWFD